MLDLLRKCKTIDIDGQQTVNLLAEVYSSGGLIKQTGIATADRAPFKLEITTENLVVVRLLEVNAKKNDD